MPGEPRYVLALDFQNVHGLPYYVRIRPDGGFDEVYSPLAAGRFESPGAALAWARDNTKLAEYARAEEAEEAVARFKTWLAGGMLRRTFEPLDRGLNRKYDRAKDDRMAVLEWRYRVRVEGDHKVQQAVYSSWPDLYSVFECLWAWQCFRDHDYKPLGVTVEVRVGRKATFGTFRDELQLVLDRCTYRDEDGDLVLPIFDHFLGEGGNTASLVRHADDAWSVRAGYYGRRAMVERKSLEECFEYIRRERYYGE